MEEKIKEIVASFIRVPVEQIGQTTPVDRTTLKNSILLHRMYAKLAEEGLAVNNYQQIKNFGELLKNLDVKGGSNTPDPVTDPAHPSAAYSSVEATPSYSPKEQGETGIGIDMEEIASMPRTSDFRKEEFYKMNFTPAEISYCILQADPYASFAGLFAAKEAIIKANNAYQSRVFNSILIDHSPEGRPLHPEFDLSISHTGDLAVAVAVAAVFRHPSLTMEKEAYAIPPQNTKASRPSLAFWMALFAVALSICTMIIAFTH